MALVINDGWEMIRKNAISKLEAYLNNGNSDILFSRKEYMQYYTYKYHFIFANYFCILLLKSIILI